MVNECVGEKYIYLNKSMNAPTFWMLFGMEPLFLMKVQILRTLNHMYKCGLRKSSAAHNKETPERIFMD